MKTKKVAHFDVGKILEVAEHSLLQLWITSENKLDKWLENEPKRKAQKKKKMPKKTTKTLAREQEEALAVQREINMSKINKRFVELETQDKSIENEFNIDLEH